MKKATKRKIILSGILFHMILVFTACRLCNKPAVIGDEISDTDFYDVAFEQMNSTHSHNIYMDAGESIKLKIISKSGKISVQTAGLDSKERVRFRHIFEQLGRDNIVLLSTHIVSDIEKCADRILVIKDGQKVFDGTGKTIRCRN